MKAEERALLDSCVQMYAVCRYFAGDNDREIEGLLLIVEEDPDRWTQQLTSVVSKNTLKKDPVRKLVRYFLDNYNRVKAEAERRGVKYEPTEMDLAELVLGKGGTPEVQ